MSNTVNHHKRLVASIIQFLEDELKSDGMTPEKAEGVEVAVQCLHMAYSTTSEDVPSTQKKLLEMFLDTCPAPKVEPLTEEQKEKAEEFKKQGNDFMKKEEYDDAIECYTKAIAIDSNNAVYFCNRAAAHTGKQAFNLSIVDCQKSLEIDPTYSKAYSRLGLTYSKMEIYDEAITCYKKAIDLDPENEGYKKNKKIAEEKLNLQNKPAASQPGMPGMEGLGGMGNFLNNPMFMNMAQQLIQNPAMQEMAMKMMGGMMGGAGGSDGGSDGQSPDMSQVLEMGQQFARQLSADNPELVDRLRSQMPSASDEAKPKDDADSADTS